MEPSSPRFGPPLTRAPTLTLLPTLTVLVVSAATLGALLSARPHLSGAPAAWPGDDLGVAVTWLAAVICSAWLALTTLACVVASSRGRHAAAARIAGWAPPLARGILQAALVGAWVVVPTVAYAAPAAPLVVRVSPAGRLMTPPAAGSALDAPVVRAPQTSRPVPMPAPDSSRVVPSPPTPAGLRVADRPYVVRSGDNLWRIARAEVTRAGGDTRPDGATIDRYWRRVVAANRGTLRSGDPSLIYAGEVVTLPD
jgi:LysM domain